MVKRTGTSFQAYDNSGSGWVAYGSSVSIPNIPSQSPAGVFVSSTIANWQATARFSNVIVSGDQPSAQELLGGGSPTEVIQGGSGYTGDFIQSYSDLSMSGRGLPLSFNRTYNSLLGSQTALAAAPYGNLGPGWTDSYDQFTTADSSGNVTVHDGNGSAVTFTYSGGAYTPPTRVLAALVANTGQTAAPNCPTSALVLTTHSQIKYAFYQITGSPPPGQPSGALCEALDLNGYPTELTYNSGDTQLTTVTECTTVSGTSCGTNRTLTMAYANSSYPNSITSVTSSANAGTGTLAVTFTYNGSGQLATSADADGNTTYYAYNTEGLLNSIQTPKEHAASAPGELIWYDASGRVRYTQDAAAKAAGLNAVSSSSYQCNYVYGTDTCSTDGTQTSTMIDANSNETQAVYVDGLMTSDTQAVGSSVAATTNYTFDQNTLGTVTTTTPANGSGASYTISYTNWFGTGTYLGDVQCSVSPGNPGAIVTETGASSSSGTATLTFSSTTAPIVGATIVVSGVTNTAYDGTFQVTAASTTSVSYAVSGSPGASSGGSFYQIQGNVTSLTYNSTYPNLIATSTNPLEQATSYNGACNTGTPTYTTTNYYGASNGTCNQTGLAAWLLACTVVQTGGSPASATTTYTYDGGTDTNVGDVTMTQDANSNNTVVTYDNYGDVLTSTKSGLSSDQCSACGGTNTTTNTYEPDGQIASTEEPDAAMGGSAAQWTANTTYDAAGNQISQTDPGTYDTVTTGTYCASGRTMLVMSNPNNIPAYPLGAWIVVAGVTPSGYNGTFQTVASSGNTVSYNESCPSSYVSGGNVVIESKNTYDGDNNVTAATDFRGNTTYS
jgi:YD repeat-containing protein